MSPAWTPYFFFDQFFTGGLKAAQALAAVGIACVDKRMKNPDVDPNRRDILHYLLIAKDPTTGGNLPNAEIKAEALTQWGHPSPPRRRKKKTPVLDHDHAEELVSSYYISSDAK